MNYHPQFYFKQKGTGAVFSHEPRGTLVIERMLEAKAPWIQTALSISQQPKALVLCDWTALAWAGSKIRKMQETFRNLIREGFPMYIWLDGEIVPMTEELIRSLDDVEFRQKITPVSNTELTEQAFIQQRLTGDEILPLDDYWIGCLDNNHTLPEVRALSLKAVSAIYSDKILLDKLFPVIKQAVPAYGFLLVDEITARSKDVQQELEGKFPSIQILFDLNDFIKKYKHSFINALNGIYPGRIKSEHELDDQPFVSIKMNVSPGFFSGAESQARQAASPGELFSYDVIVDGENTPITSINILMARYYLIKICPHLERLEFQRYYPIELFESLGFESKKYTELRFVKAPASAITAKGLEQLLNGCPGLRVLDLSQCENYSLSEQPLKLPQLEEIIFSGRRLKLNEQVVDNIAFARQKLLAASPNLKQLAMEGQVLMHPGFAAGLKLTKLEILNLSASNITPEDFHQLVKHSSNLRELDLSGVTSNLLAKLALINLSRIEKIKFPASVENLAPDEYAKQLVALLHNMPNLKQLDLSCLSEAEMAAIDFSKLSFKRLESYVFPELEKYSFAAAKLHFQAAPCLTRYPLVEVDDKSEPDKQEEIPTANLRELEIDYCTLSSNQFASLLDGAARLDDLLILDSQIQGEQFSITPMQNLKTLRFKNSSLNLQLIEKLIHAAPNLRRLYCDDTLAYALEEAKLVKPLNLSSLEYLEISTTQLFQYELMSLLAGCRKLRVLQINGMNMPVVASSSDESSFSGAMSEHSALAEGEHRSLETMNFSYLEKLIAHSLSFDVLQSILSTSTQLKRLSYYGAWPENLSVNLPSLEFLDIYSASFVLSEGENPSLRKLLEQSGKNLQRLYFPYSSSIWGKNVFKGLQLPNLKIFQMNDFSVLPEYIDRDSLVQLLKAAPNLNVLNLGAEVNIPLDNEVVALLKQVPNIMLAGIKFDIESYKARKDALRQSKAEAASSSSEPPSDPVVLDGTHDPLFFRDYKPADRNEPFRYQGKKRSLSQNMIIEQLCQYFTLTKQYEYMIPKIQGGCCVALSQLFVQTLIDDWEDIVDLVSEWNGSIHTIDDELMDAFDNLIDAIRKYQFGTKYSARYFVGDGKWQEFLEQDKGSYVVTNPWHAIAVKYDDEQQEWLVYDPNYHQGYKRCSAEELKDWVQRSLGTLIDLKVVDSIALEMHNPSDFIKNGGLLSLCFAKNYQQILPQLPLPARLEQAALDGILLRNAAQGEPAWAIALNSKHPEIRDYSKRLLEAFISQRPSNWQEELRKSLACMSNMSIHQLISQLYASSSEKGQGLLRPTLEAIAEALRQRIKPEHIELERLQQYKKALQTWKREEAPQGHFKSFCKSLFYKAPDNQLIELADRSSIDQLGLQIQDYCRKTSRDCFYIDSPEDIVCQAPFVRRDGQKGYLSKGPGGALYDFLTKERQPGEPDPLLLVNYDNFEPDDLVRFNALIDKHRQADRIDLPPSMKLIGLFNPNKLDSYQGSDFFSRFGRIKRTNLGSGMPLPKPVKVSKTKTSSECIKLFHGQDWKEQLLGHWVIQGNQLSFREGKLITALKNKKSMIQIENGLWEDRVFRRFFEEARRLGYIEHAGQRIPVPSDIQWVRKEGYDWQASARKIHLSYQPFEAHDALLLNPSTLSEFFIRYHCDNETGSLSTKPGWLTEKNRGKTYQVKLTRELSEDEWARLDDACRQFNISLQCHVADGLSIPEFLAFQEAASSASSSSMAGVSSQIQPWKGQSEGDMLIQSDEPDTSIAEIIQNDPADWLVLDISEFEPSDFIRRLKTDIKDKNNPHFYFSETDLVLTEALNAGKKLILKGDASPGVCDALTAVFLNRAAEKKPAGQLLLVSESAKNFHALPVLEHKTSVQDKYRCLKQQGYSKAELSRFSEQQLQAEPLTQIKTRLDYLRHHPDADDSDAAWQGMLHLQGDVQTGEFDPSSSAEQAKAFQENRLKDVLQILSQSPYVYLSGLTAVGKTSFVETSLCIEPNRLYTGERSMKAWAKDDAQGMKILFIDEANLADIDFNAFEGLYHPAPSIIIKGKRYPLTPEHKLVFAGNPLSYGAGRKMPEFFKRHGNALVFEPLSLAFVYEEVLKPVFANTRLQSKATEFSAEILQAYRFLCECSTERVLISPRELQMIALLTVSFCEKNPGARPEKALAHYIRQLAAPLVPAAHQAAFNERFPELEISTGSAAAASSSSASSAEQRPLAGKALGDYWLTASRAEVAREIEAWLDLRAYRQNNNALNAAQKYGGLGALVLEGSPAAGKSELLIALLHERGFREAKMEHPSSKGDAFYRMSQTMSLKEKKTMLLKAFNEGAIVLVDEINSSPMLERFMNALLMGKNPKAKKDEPLRPKRPGFMLFGTQNPAGMQGRIRAGEALSRRQHQVNLPDYSLTEVMAILLHKGFHPEHVKLLAEAFNQQVEKAKNEQLRPQPTLRDLLELETRFPLRTAPAHLATLKGEKQMEQQLVEKKISIINRLEEHMNHLDAIDKPHGFFKANSGIMPVLKEFLNLIKKDPVEEYELSHWYGQHYQDLSSDESSQTLVASIIREFNIDLEVPEQKSMHNK